MLSEGAAASQPLPSSSALPVSSHRLPTVSATQALKDLQANAPSPLVSGLPQLDSILANNGSLDTFQSSTKPTGLQRGTLTEIWGPSGSGKTTLAMQFAAHTLRSGQQVVWIDASTPLAPSRLSTILSSPLSDLDLNNQFHHLPLPTLSHILTLLLFPPASIALATSSLLVLENLSSPLDAAYPRHPVPSTYQSNPTFSGLSSGGGARGPQSEAQKWAANRRYAVTGTVGAALKKVATLHGLAVVVTCGAVTRGRGKGRGAGLGAGLGGVEWERSVACRIGLFRDYSRGCGSGGRGGEAGGKGTREGRAGKGDDLGQEDGGVETRAAGKGGGKREEMGRGGWKNGWYLSITKAGGRNLLDPHGHGLGHGDDFDGQGDLGLVIPVEISSKGMREVRAGQRGAARIVSPKKQTVKSKRKFDEVADSDSEVGSEYGWDEGDEIAAEGLIDEDELVVVGEGKVGAARGDEGGG
ncbi:hypothetical protein KVT40_001977 [Elsinoe batatas]|uniref:RecA family profile 1 domain-containing protein n=1 Tax=Elsinoe batatas TaxID=2601811 RepID=A0A8K0PK93_9PEZI|nr:hypothetical protein KVT40_001977 [Elsinoe batatas]